MLRAPGTASHWWSHLRCGSTGASCRQLQSIAHVLLYSIVFRCWFEGDPSDCGIYGPQCSVPCTVSRRCPSLSTCPSLLCHTHVIVTSLNISKCFMACCSGSPLRVPQMHHSTVAASHKQGTPIPPLSDAHAHITAPVKPFATPQRTRTSLYTLQLQAQQDVQLVPHVSTVASLHRRLALELAAGALLQPLAALPQPCAAYAAQPSSPQQVQVIFSLPGISKA